MDSAQLNSLSIEELLELLTTILCILLRRFNRRVRLVRGLPETTGGESDRDIPAFAYTISCAYFSLRCIPADDRN